MKGTECAKKLKHSFLNEGNGVCKEIEALVSQKLLIPNYPQGKDTSESLNVAVATAIVCAEFRRRLS